MSLDVYLTKKVLVPAHTEEQEVYKDNVTHNLGSMAVAAEIYKVLWRPEELFENPTAADLIPLLEAGLERLKADPVYFKQYDASNGWGLYEDLVSFVEQYLKACREDPDAKVTVNR